MTHALLISLLALIAAIGTIPAQGNPSPTTMQNDRFTLEKEGAILWDVTKTPRLPHSDKMELSGKRASLILSYGADADGKLSLSRHVVWPMLRTVPNDTHASLQKTFTGSDAPALLVDGKPAVETLKAVRIKGTVELQTTTDSGLVVTRTLFASTTLPAAIERVVVRNDTPQAHRVDMGPRELTWVTEAAKGVYGPYYLAATVHGEPETELKSGRTVAFGVVYGGLRAGEEPLKPNINQELREREKFVKHLFETLILETPDPVIDRMFAFAKVRAAESIFETKGGLMHAPGGGSYYAAIWANDQAEYANPFFAYLGDETADESALNAYRHFARFMNPDYKRIPSSIIAEGTDIWNGAGDRGDMAMIAYGAARYALTRGDKKIAEELWPLITWCLEYLRRQTNADGVIHSDSDELEGRFPAGKFNLNTSALTYDALVSTGYLGRDLDKPDAEEYGRRSFALRHAIEKFFGADLYGFKTYRYYDGNTTLRAWICTPLCMGIYDRASGTLDALLSEHLWTVDGIRSEMGSQTFWDRATLYAMRGALAAGAQDRVLPYLAAYSRRRLLGDHVPYAIEAWPEGDQRHLSAESALYCRVLVEGLLRFRPTGLDGFNVKPNLPTGWDRIQLRRLHVAGTTCDLEAYRENGEIKLKVHGGKFKIRYDKTDGSFDVWK